MEKNIKQKILYIIVTVLFIVGMFISYLFGLLRNIEYTHDVKTSNQHGDMLVGKNNQSAMEHTMTSMTNNLQSKSGAEFEQAFLSDMIIHHQGAVDMAKLVLEHSKRPELLKLAHDIILAQTKEINMMKGWGSLWFNTSSIRNPLNQDDAVACTMEVKICPDGSAVGRKGPHCEFSPCPEN